MNIITIVIDTLRYDYVGANGAPNIHTPNLDRLAEKSWNFHRAFIGRLPTIPHRKDVITGRYGGPFHPWAPLPCSVATIPMALHEMGYCTQLIHDTPHLVNGGHNFDFPFHCWTPVRGAEVDRAWITEDWGDFNNWARDPLFDKYENPNLYHDEKLGLYLQTNRHRKTEEDWNVARLFTIASQFLRDNKSRDNFYLWIDSFDPHEPWDAPPEFMLMYDKTPGYDGRIDPRSLPQGPKKDPDLPEAAAERIKASYAAKVKLMDKWFGVFLDTLEETGLDKNTAIILTADHGTNVRDREGHPFGKTSPPRENEAHVPFMVCVPGAAEGHSDAIVQPQDIFATVMGLAGGSIPDGIESFDALQSARQGSDGPRSIALSGGAIGKAKWGKPDEALFSVFDKEWRLGVAANPGACLLERLGTREDLTSQHQDVVERLREAAIKEMARRGLDPGWVEWLKGCGQDEPPTESRDTDAAAAPEGWRFYWLHSYPGK